MGKEGPSGRPERAESQSIREEKGKGKKRRDKEKEQPAQVLEKKRNKLSDQALPAAENPIFS